MLCIFKTSTLFKTSKLLFSSKVVCITTLATLILFSADLLSVAAQDHSRSPANEIQALLDSGEFASAIALAEQVNESDARDQILQQIAQKQFDSGVRSGAFATASDMSSDIDRSSLLADFADKRFHPMGAAGGGAVADFDPLIELIQDTIAPDTWIDTGGTGTVAEFRSGVSVDAAGVLKFVKNRTNPRLEALRKEALSRSGNSKVTLSSSLRKVSITRLEKQYQLRVASGMPIDESMQYMAGIYKIDYLLVYPKTGDLVIAGPAGPWMIDEEGRRVNIETGKPVLRLDDFVVCLRNAFNHESRFGCSINPRPENLKATQQFLTTSKRTGKSWRDGLREALGKQDITVDGIDPQTVTAKTIVEADYRMKLVGMGLEDGVAGVKSYLDSIKLTKEGVPPTMDVARWWFTMNYKGIVSTEERTAFQFIGTGVKVLSEKERLNKKGERVHTGKTAGPTLEFATSFTTHFDELATDYPIYAELRNVFDMALVAALIHRYRLDKEVDWNRTYFGSPTTTGKTQTKRLNYQPKRATAPTEVATVMNHKILENRRSGARLKHQIVGVSGGVEVACHVVTDKALKADDNGKVKVSHNAAQPQSLEKTAWWWD